MTTEGRFAATRWNRLKATMVKDVALRIYDLQKRELLSSGYPPGSRPLSETEQYQQLAMWRMTFDPRFTPQAAARLSQLEQRFGPAPAPPPPQPFA